MSMQARPIILLVKNWYIFLYASLLPFQNDSIDPETFTFEKFYKIYQSLCPRTDIDDLFSQM